MSATINIQSVNCRNASSLIEDPAVKVLDVRTPVEFEEKHIAGSKLHPLDQIDKGMSQLSRDDHHLLICLAGKRAQQAAEKLAAAGFEKLTVMEGGVAAWEQAGLPLNRSERKVLPLMRQVQLVIGLLALTGSLLALLVNPLWAILPAFLGAGLTMAGSTGWCGLAILLSKMPWNKTQSCQGNSCSL